MHNLKPENRLFYRLVVLTSKPHYNYRMILEYERIDIKLPNSI